MNGISHIKNSLIVLSLLLVNQEKIFCQKIKYISNYFVRYDSLKDENIFIIHSDTFSFKNSGGETYSLNGKTFFTCPKDSFVFVEVYSDQYLLFSFYPNKEGYIQTGPGIRKKKLTMFVSIANNQQRWFFDLSGLYNSTQILRFDSLTGTLLLQGDDRKKHIIKQIQ